MIYNIYYMYLIFKYNYDLMVSYVVQDVSLCHLHKKNIAFYNFEVKKQSRQNHFCTLRL